MAEPDIPYDAPSAKIKVSLVFRGDGLSRAFFSSLFDVALRPFLIRQLQNEFPFFHLTVVGDTWTSDVMLVFIEWMKENYFFPFLTGLSVPVYLHPDMLGLFVMESKGLLLAAHFETLLLRHRSLPDKFEEENGLPKAGLPLVQCLKTIQSRCRSLEHDQPRHSLQEKIRLTKDTTQQLLKVTSCGSESSIQTIKKANV